MKRACWKYITQGTVIIRASDTASMQETRYSWAAREGSDQPVYYHICRLIKAITVHVRHLWAFSRAGINPIAQVKLAKQWSFVQSVCNRVDGFYLTEKV